MGVAMVIPMERAEEALTMRTIALRRSGGSLILVMSAAGCQMVWKIEGDALVIKPASKNQHSGLTVWMQRESLIGYLGLFLFSDEIP